MSNITLEEREVMYTMIDRLSQHIHAIEDRLNAAEVSVEHQGKQIGTLKHDLSELDNTVDCIKSHLNNDGEECGE